MLRNIPNIRLGSIVAIVLASILVAAQKIEMIDGVRVIHNEKGGQWGAS